MSRENMEGKCHACPLQKAAGYGIVTITSYHCVGLELFCSVQREGSGASPPLCNPL